MDATASRIGRLADGLPATFWWLWSGAVASALATFVFPFLALFLAARGFGVAATGRLVSLYGAGIMIAGPLGGRLADRLGRRATMLGALGTSAALTALLGALSAPPLIAAAVLALGVAGQAYLPAANAMVADIVPAERRAQAYGLLHWGRNIGVAVSFIVGGLLAGAGYGWLFLADAISTLVFTLLVAYRLPETRPAVEAPPEPAAAPEPSPGDPGAVPGSAAKLSSPHRPARGDGTLIAFLALVGLLCLAFYQFMAALPLAMGALGFGTATYGRVLAVNGIMIGLFQPAISTWARRRDPSRILALSALCVGAGYGGYAFCRTASAFGLATATWTLGEILMMPLAATVVAGLSPASERGAYQGRLGFTYGAALLLAPTAGTMLLDRAGARCLWAACALVATAGAAGQIALRPALRRRLAR